MTEEVVTMMCITFSYSNCSDITGLSRYLLLAEATFMFLARLLNLLLVAKLLT